MVISFGWKFGIQYDPIFLRVIWALGCSMVALAALVWLPWRILLLLSLAMVGLHNTLNGLSPAQFGSLGWLWAILHVQTSFEIPGGPTVRVAYPLIPWIGVMAAGFCRASASRCGRHRGGRRRDVTSAVTMIRAADRFAAVGLPAQAQVGVFVGDAVALAAFATLVACGVYFRRSAALHKRLMFLAGLSIIGPALTATRRAGRMIDTLLPEALRLVGLGFPLLLGLCLIALIARDAAVDERVQPETTGAILTLFAAAGIAAAAVYAAGGSATYIAFLRAL